MEKKNMFPNITQSHMTSINSLLCPYKILYHNFQQRTHLD